MTNKGTNSHKNNKDKNNNKQHYVFGDVVFVVRRIGLVDQALYHHAGMSL